MAESVYNKKYPDPDGNQKLIVHNRTNICDDMMHITDEDYIYAYAERFNKHNKRGLWYHAMKTKDDASNSNVEFKDENICEDAGLSFHNNKSK